MQQQQHQEPDKEMEEESAHQMVDTGNEDLGAGNLDSASI